MDDLIYILLGVAWIIYAAYRANQKQKKKVRPVRQPSSASPPIPDPKPRSLETIFQEILREDSTLEVESLPETESYDEVAIKEMEKERQSFGKPKAILETIPQEEGISAFDYAQEDITQALYIPGEDDAYITQEDLSFDLRKAVIYTEILNRPYR